MPVIRAKTLQDLFKRYRRPGDIVFAWVFLAFSLFLLLNLDAQTATVKGTKWAAQPSFWPTVAVYTMVVFGALHLISSFVSPKLDGRWQEVGFWLRSFEFATWFMAYVILVPQLGYLPSTVLFTIVLTIRLGYPLHPFLGAAVALAVTVVVIFKSLLQVKVPGGQVYEYLPDALRSFMLTYF
ncbi:tripartite tricarboxylate transporter TctB family protein [Lentibacter algarum]|uniref:tripartite tricarboxylate transporter TctB family protein n=1 Tax=Lentibacter algarum TaxID=576131 RepID=UPI0020910AF6|nr:tripartite tricarboxylate transporter TctB family protein [Lentibacter algarum]